MITISVSTADYGNRRIKLGKQGEHEVRQIAFDLTFMIERYGDGLATLVFQRNGDPAPYTITATRSENLLTWTVNETDTAVAGPGKAEIRWYVSGALAKTVIFTTETIESMVSETEVPDRLQTWYDQLIDYVDEQPQLIIDDVQGLIDGKADAYTVANTYAKKTDVPTKTSQLTNDSGFLTELPSGYVTEQDLASKGYLTEDDISGKADQEDLDVLSSRFDSAVSAVSTATELTDIRVTVDGTTETTAGTAVRKQVQDLKDDISSLNEDLILANDGYATLNGTWQIGNLSGTVGNEITINTAFRNRLAGVTQYKFDYDTTFFIHDGYRAYIFIVDENNILLANPKAIVSGGSVNIPSNTIVRIGIEKIPVEAITNINEYVSALTHTTKAFVDIANLKETVDVIQKNSIFGIFKKGMRPMLFSHAGYKVDYPGNTIPAFIAAGEKKYFGIESDVNVTNDGYFVMIHDTTVDSTTSGTGNVADLTLAEIRALHIKNHPDLQVPTLEEYLGICKMYGCVPMIEIKGTLKKEHIGNMIDVIKKYAIQHDVILIGSKWNIENVREFTNFIPYLCVYQKSFSVTFETELTYCKNYKNAGMLFEYTYELTSEQIQSAHAADIAIGAFVIDVKTDVHSAFVSGYDSVTTNTVVL